MLNSQERLFDAMSLPLGLDRETAMEARAVLAELDAGPPQQGQPPAAPAGGSRFGRNALAAGELALGALPFTRLGRAMFSSLPRAAASATGLTAAGVGAQHLVQPAEAAEPPTASQDELAGTRQTISGLRARQGELEAERAKLSTERTQFDKIDPGNKEAVAGAQRLLGIKPDGSWGVLTAKAIAEHKQAVSRQMTALERQAERLTKDLEGQEQRLMGLEGGQRLKESQENVDPLSNILRKGGELGGTALGIGLGAVGRISMVAKANKKALQNARLVEAMMERKMTAVQPRTGRLNELYRQGGAPPEAAPFINPAPGTKYGAAINPAAASPSTLFPGRPGIRGQVTGTDASIMAGAGLEGGVAEYRRHLADQEVAEAQAAANKDPSELNIERLQRAINNAAFWQSLARVGQAGAISYGVTSTKTPRLYPRPNLQRADAELANLSRLIAPPPPPPKPPRKRSR